MESHIRSKRRASPFPGGSICHQAEHKVAGHQLNKGCLVRKSAHYLDDVSSKVCQQPATKVACHNLTDIQDLCTTAISNTAAVSVDQVNHY